MKKYLSAIMAAIMLVCCLSGCGGRAAANEKLTIVTTIFPEYDWVMNILGDNPADAQVTMLLDNGVDLHSYQPTADDIIKISTCDVFIYVGGESDGWMEDALKEAVNRDMKVVGLLDALGGAVKEEEIVEGMQEEHEEEEVGDNEGIPADPSEAAGGSEGLSSSEEQETDEHVWLSLRNAQVLVRSITRALSEADPGNAGTYNSNCEAYIKKLSALDSEYEAAVSAGDRDTLLFGDRFPFRYLTDDYGLSYYAAFAGCSAETEASFETVSFLARKADELDLGAVMTIEGADNRIADTIIQNTGSKDMQILTMDSMQSITKEDVENGVTYLSVMEKNLSALKEALK